MRTSQYQGLSRLRLYLLGLFACLNSGLLEADSSVLIIKSNENPFFSQTIEQLVGNTSRQWTFHISDLENLRDAAVPTNPDYLVTLGRNAAETAIDRFSKATVIHSYLTLHDYQELQIPKHHHVAVLDQPLHRYLSFIQQLIPGARVGIPLTEHNRINARQLSDLEQAQATNVERSIFYADDNPINLVRKLLKRNDVLLALPQPELFNRKTLKGILLTSYRMDKPMISYSPSHVKSGALAAIYTSPGQIGRQLAGLLEKHALNQLNPGQNPIYASDYEISINQRVARSLGLDIPEQERLNQQPSGGESE